MRTFIPFFIVLSMLASIGISYSFISDSEEKVETIEWLTWEEAIQKNEKKPKKIFIDVYTDWCGWCKKMDASTFKDKNVVKYMNDNFYAVKLDAEMKKDVVYKGHTFKFVDAGRRGYHELAASLLENRLSYPSFVAMDEEVNRITIIPGYHDANGILPILQFIGKNKYKTMSYDDYEKNLLKK